VRRILSLAFILFLLQGCVAYTYGPRGVTCKGGDINVGGSNDTAAVAEANRKACEGPLRNPTYVGRCCYKVLLVVTQSCPIYRGGRVLEGAPCFCAQPSPYGVTTVPGIGCADGDDD